MRRAARVPPPTFVVAAAASQASRRSPAQRLRAPGAAVLPEPPDEHVRLVLVHPARVILPELAGARPLRPGSSRTAASRSASASASSRAPRTGAALRRHQIAARTLVWTAGTRHPLLGLPCEKDAAASASTPPRVPGGRASGRSATARRPRRAPGPSADGAARDPPGASRAEHRRGAARRPQRAVPFRPRPARRDRPPHRRRADLRLNSRASSPGGCGARSTCEAPARSRRSCA